MGAREFEPGSVVCEDCKSRPDDGWNDSPEGFNWFKQWNMWICDECVIEPPALRKALRQAIANAGNPDPVEACRLVIETCKRALGDKT